MKKFGVILLVTVIILVGVACGKEQSKPEITSAPKTNAPAASDSTSKEVAISLADIQADLKGELDPIPTGEFYTYTVKLQDPSGNPVDADKVYLFMNMEGMHHPTEGTMHVVEKGVYQLELPLAMAGEWYAEVTLSQGNEERTLDRFTVQAEGKKFMMYMKGYNADLGASHVTQSDTEMDHDHGDMDRETEDTNTNP